MNLGDYREKEHFEIFNYLKKVETPVYDDKPYSRLYLDRESSTHNEDKQDKLFEQAKKLFDDLTIQKLSLHFRFNKKPIKNKKLTKKVVLLEL